MATRRTQLRRRKVPVQWKVGSPVPFRLVFQFTEYFAERRVRNMFGQIVVLNHPGHVQSFDIDRLVLADDLGREFLKRVPSSIADSGVQSGYFESGLSAIIAPLDLARHTTLKFLQALFAPDEWARIFQFFAVAGRGERLNAYVYASFCFCLFERLNFGFNEDADKMASTRIPADRQIDDFRILGERPTPGDIERFGLPGESDAAVSICEGISGIADRLTRSSGFEFPILSLSCSLVAKNISPLWGDATKSVSARNIQGLACRRLHMKTSAR